jgi:2-polyprenyl-3-methyl-5-hydroxy-6-metoxy-1,4-benzoquinol methylase
MLDCEDTRYFKILNNNKGFLHPEKWISYAKKNNFQKVKAIKIHECPECKSKTNKKYGQYIHYSNLIQILECKYCGLIFSDVKLNDEVVKHHFEITYKNEKYFEIRRHDIFTQIVSIVEKHLPKIKTIIDIGGAKGHLASMMKLSRPALDITINDLSSDACNYIKSTHGFKTLCCSLADLINHKNCYYDLILLIDVLYYESDLKNAFEFLKYSIAENGLIIIRIPNKLWLIKSFSFFKRCFHHERKRELEDTIHFHNPEHLFVFSQRYIKRKFRSLGFNKTIFIPSKSLCSENKIIKYFMNILFIIAMFIFYLSFKKIIITPSKLALIYK